MALSKGFCRMWGVGHKSLRFWPQPPAQRIDEPLSDSRKGLDDEAVLRRLDEARWDQKVIRSICSKAWRLQGCCFFADFIFQGLLLDLSAAAKS